jgi:hypothetical protein
MNKIIKINNNKMIKKNGMGSPVLVEQQQQQLLGMGSPILIEPQNLLIGKGVILNKPYNPNLRRKPLKLNI